MWGGLQPARDFSPAGEARRNPGGGGLKPPAGSPETHSPTGVKCAAYLFCKGGAGSQPAPPGLRPKFLILVTARPESSSLKPAPQCLSLNSAKVSRAAMPPVDP